MVELNINIENVDHDARSFVEAFGYDRHEVGEKIDQTEKVFHDMASEDATPDQIISVMNEQFTDDVQLIFSMVQMGRVANPTRPYTTGNPALDQIATSSVKEKNNPTQTYSGQLEYLLKSIKDMDVSREDALKTIFMAVRAVGAADPMSMLMAMMGRREQEDSGLPF